MSYSLQYISHKKNLSEGNHKANRYFYQILLQEDQKLLAYHISGLRVIEALNQLHGGTFATARGAH